MIMTGNFSIEFVNHASFIIKTKEIKLLCDPWLFGSAFHDGWDLLIETKFDFDRFNEITHIWFSHEHPDHFSPPVLKKIKEAYRKNITILYQETKDKKVLNFCKSIGFKTLELPDYETTKLTSGFEIMCANVPFFDSWLYCNIDGVKVLNANDCVVDGDAKVEKIKKYTGVVDLLFTQFSYAGWKGNKEDTALRAEVAKMKLDIVKNQIKVLQPKYTIPFASFVYFSHRDNSFMNDAVNLPDVACKAIEEENSKAILLYPEDEWTYGQEWNNDTNIEKYLVDFKNIPNKVFRVPAKSIDEVQLIENSKNYITRLKTKNKWWLVNFAKAVPALHFFKPINILVTDHQKVYTFDINKGLALSKAGIKEDVIMHSESLDYIFKFDFGYETLTVNGRFEANFDGLSKMTKIFSIGPMNNMGKYINAKWLLSNFSLVFEFFKILSRTKKMLNKQTVI